MPSFPFELFSQLTDSYDIFHDLRAISGYQDEVVFCLATGPYPQTPFSKECDPELPMAMAMPVS
jgi:hypothetical protein